MWMAVKKASEPETQQPETQPETQQPETQLETQPLSETEPETQPEEDHGTIAQ